MPTTSSPILAIQTGSLWASGDASRFTGTGGPGYDPFLDAFNGVVSSAVIATQPFNDSLQGVDAGDQVVFVVAVQNFANATEAFNVMLRDLVPVGFEIPSDGADLLVTDGAGNLLDTSGNLFDPNGGLVINDPIGAYSDDSGANVVLVTFTLQATSTVAVPLATLTNTAQIVSYAASVGGTNLAGSSTTPLSASTPVTTNGISVTSAADQASTPLGSGQTASFDITITLPEGTAQNLQINELLPLAGNAGLSLVSAQIVQFGANLTATLPVMAQPGGAILLGNVTDAYDNVETAADQIVVRLTVANGGTSAGTGTISTVVSATDPNAAGQSWSTTVTNTVPLAQPDVPPTITGVSPAQHTTGTLPVFPFASLLLADPDIGQTETLTIHLSDPSLGTLGGVSDLSTDASGNAVLSGSIAAVQADIRNLVFTPTSGAVGVETFGLTLNDGDTGVATNQNTTVTIAASAHPSDLVQFPISTQTVLTSTATGSSTLAAVQTYFGPIDNVQTQFLYDGTAALAIVAQQSNMLISSNADATAIQLQGGNNVIDVGNGSTFVTGGSGNDVFLFQAGQAQPTWNTVINFHPGDSITVYGFNAATSSDWWEASAGAAGYTGATLRMDLNRDGTVDSSITFAGKNSADTGHLSLTTGSVAGQNYLLITQTA